MMGKMSIESIDYGWFYCRIIQKLLNGFLWKEPFGADPDNVQECIQECPFQRNACPSKKFSAC